MAVQEGGFGEHRNGGGVTDLDLRWSGICVVVGAVAFATIRLMHGDTPAGDAGAALDFVHRRPSYPLVHVFALLAALVTVIGLLGLHRSLSRPPAVVLGRAGAASALVGLAIFGVESTAEGLGLSQLAAAAESAGPAQRADLVVVARAVAETTYGPSLVGMALLVGLPVLLFGLAAVADSYPSWLGWAGAAIGAVTAAMAVGIFLWPPVAPGALLYGVLGSIVAQLWLVGAGVAMLRRSARPVVPSS